MIVDFCSGSLWYLRYTSNIIIDFQEFFVHCTKGVLRHIHWVNRSFTRATKGSLVGNSYSIHPRNFIDKLNLHRLNTLTFLNGILSSVACHIWPNLPCLKTARNRGGTRLASKISSILVLQKLASDSEAWI